MIEIERADAEIVADLSGGHDGVDGFGKREKVDGNAIDGQIGGRLRFRLQHVDLLMTMWPRYAFTEAADMPIASAMGTCMPKDFPRRASSRNRTIATQRWRCRFVIALTRRQIIH